MVIGGSVAANKQGKLRSLPLDPFIPILLSAYLVHYSVGDAALRELRLAILLAPEELRLGIRECASLPTSQVYAPCWPRIKSVLDYILTYYRHKTVAP